MTEKKTVADKPNPNLAIWEQSDKPPKSALKQIKGGRISGMTDINPQWRFHKLTEIYGAAGHGWWTVETKREFVPCGDEIAVFVDIELYTHDCEHPIQGNGGNVFRVNETRGLRLNDEAVKMATTDAISVCCKQLGIGSAIYEGKWDGNKYAEDAPVSLPVAPAKAKQTKAEIDFLQSCGEAKKLIGDKGYYSVLGECGFEKSSGVGNKDDRAKVLLALRTHYEMNQEEM